LPRFAVCAELNYQQAFVRSRPARLILRAHRSGRQRDNPAQFRASDFLPKNHRFQPVSPADARNVADDTWRSMELYQ
jgi:hypothetical protein